MIGDHESEDVIELDVLKKLPDTKFKVVRVFSGDGKFIDKECIYKNFNKTYNNCLAAICGPPAMMKSICGEREEKTVTGILEELGWKDDEVYKF